MTEEEWLTANFAMLLMQSADGYGCDADGNTTDGQWRSIAARVACLELLGADLPEGVRDWVERAIKFLDEEDRRNDADPIRYWNESEVYASFRTAYVSAAFDLQQRLAAAQDAFRGADYYASEYYMLDEDHNSPVYNGPLYLSESTAHCRIIRDIFGNPFRPVAADPAWLTSTAVAIAKGMYESRDFGAMPILADALQDAGCDNDDVLQHCRDEKATHVRGCWVVDLVLGKE